MSFKIEYHEQIKDMVTHILKRCNEFFVSPDRDMMKVNVDAGNMPREVMDIVADKISKKGLFPEVYIYRSEHSFWVGKISNEQRKDLRGENSSSVASDGNEVAE